MCALIFICAVAPVFVILQTKGGEIGSGLAVCEGSVARLFRHRVNWIQSTEPKPPRGYLVLSDVTERRINNNTAHCEDLCVCVCVRVCVRTCV